MFKPNRKNTVKKLYLKFIFGFSGFIIIFSSFFILIQWVRQGMDNIFLDILFERIRAYFFGYLSAFSEWVGGNMEMNIYSGFITFAGPFNLFGFMDRPLGFYEPVNIADGISTLFLFQCSIHLLFIRH